MSTSDLTAKHLRPGALFCDRYRIEERLDDGGMATVYRATDTQTDEARALKVLFYRYADNEVVRARFLDEGRIQAMLDHPNIVRVHEVITDPLLSFTMEFVDGPTLDDYLGDHHPLDEAQIIDLMMPVMSAVGFAHGEGVIHRDLKPSNILLDTSTGHLSPKVMDFGVAKISRGEELTVDGTTVGTLHYMSPEQIVGSSDIDGRADIYSLGCSLYKLATGEVPFNASSEFALMMAHVEAQPMPPDELRDNLSPTFSQVILRALEKKPEDRFQSIRDMTQALMAVGDIDAHAQETVTKPIPEDLLDFAMAADEVATDKTSDFRLSRLQEGADQLQATEELAPITGDTRPIDRTHELSADAFRKLEKDRLQAVERQMIAQKTKSNPTRQKNSDGKTQKRDISDLITEPDATVEQHLSPGDVRTDDDLYGPLGATEPHNKATRPMDRPMDRPTTMELDEEDLAEVKAPPKVAISQPGVDSQEVTNLMDRQRLQEGSVNRSSTDAGPDESSDPTHPTFGHNVDRLDEATTLERHTDGPANTPDPDDEPTAVERLTRPVSEDADAQESTEREAPDFSAGPPAPSNADNHSTPSPNSPSAATPDRRKTRRSDTESSDGVSPLVGFGILLFVGLMAILLAMLFLL